MVVIFLFWEYFCKKYPGSDNKEFNEIYKKISSQRIHYGAHYNAMKITQDEFDDLMKIGMSDIYSNNKKLCDDYKKWLYRFN